MTPKPTNSQDMPPALNAFKSAYESMDTHRLGALFTGKVQLQMPDEHQPTIRSNEEVRALFMRIFEEARDHSHLTKVTFEAESLDPEHTTSTSHELSADRIHGTFQRVTNTDGIQDPRFDVPVTFQISAQNYSVRSESPGWHIDKLLIECLAND